MSCTAVVLVAVESRGEGFTWDLRAPFSNQAAALRTRHPRIWRHVRQPPGDFSYPSAVNFPGQRSPRTSSGHAAGSRLLHAAQCCGKKLLENDRKKKCQMTDEECPEEKKFRQRMERLAADPAEVRRSPIRLSIDPRGETSFTAVARCASNSDRTYGHREITNRSTMMCRGSKENLSPVETQTVLE